MITAEKEIGKWFRDLEIKTGATKTRLGMAAILSYMTFSPEERSELLQWSTMIDSGQIGLDAFSQMLEMNKKERRKALNDALEVALRNKD